MISRSKSKLLRSLQQKKFRDANGLFLVEGEKLVEEFLAAEAARKNAGPVDNKAPGGISMKVRELFATGQWLSENSALTDARLPVEFTECEEEEIRKISSLVSPRPVIALVEMPQEADDEQSAQTVLSGLDGPVLVLESLRDPGNLGTIIRTADWFGIRDIICSPDSADIFNPKVVQSTMGAILRVRVHYLDLSETLTLAKEKGKEVLGTFLGGEDLYKAKLPSDPLLLFGNESHGISPALEALVNRKITIPSFAPDRGSESLNVASSLAVFCSEIRRRQ